MFCPGTGRHLCVGRQPGAVSNTVSLAERNFRPRTQGVHAQWSVLTPLTSSALSLRQRKSSQMREAGDRDGRRCAAPAPGLGCSACTSHGRSSAQATGAALTARATGAVAMAEAGAPFPAPGLPRAQARCVAASVPPQAAGRKPNIFTIWPFMGKACAGPALGTQPSSPVLQPAPHRTPPSSPVPCRPG